MQDITIENNKVNEDPKFVVPMVTDFKRNGDDTARVWEMAKIHDSVHVAVYNRSRDVWVFTEQVRVPVKVNNPSSNGAVVECCAGIVDKEKSILEIAAEEVQEELGYTVQANEIQFVNQVVSEPGSLGKTVWMFYVVVTDEQKTAAGGGIGDEDIDIVEVPANEIDDFFDGAITDVTTTCLINDPITRRRKS